MARRYFILRKSGPKLITTWWTDDDPPSRGERTTRKPQPVKTLKRAKAILLRATTSFPEEHYEIKMED